LRIAYLLTEDEYIQGQRLFRERSLPRWRRMLRKLTVPIGILLIFGGFIPTVMGHLPRSTHFVVEPWCVDVGLILAVSFGAALIPIYWFGPDLSASKSFHEQDMNQEITVDVDFDRVRLETAVGHSEMLWDAFTGYSESETVFTISYISKKFFWIIPKRAFTCTDLQAFEDLISAKLPQKGDVNPRSTARPEAVREHIGIS
jgi:hypothetical protein